jgi:(p)ppGpp synthase/HD superfamily hydrolase
MSKEIPNPPLTDRFVQALAFGRVVHAAQTRKGTAIPYLSHLLGVASLVLEHGVDEDTAIAALLHDAAEDGGGRPMLAQIAARFGSRVAAIVEGCSDTFEKPKPDWRKRKTDYLAHLEQADWATCVVSAADKLHNARTILHDLRNREPDVLKRFSASDEQTGWYYGSVARVLHRKLAGTDAVALASALFQTIDDIAAHAHGGAFRIGAELGKAGKDCPHR